MSFGGRICLIKSVLSSLSLYYISFLKVPKKMVIILNSIQKKNSLKLVTQIFQKKLIINKNEIRFATYDGNMRKIKLIERVIKANVVNPNELHDKVL